MLRVRFLSPSRHALHPHLKSFHIRYSLCVFRFLRFPASSVNNLSYRPDQKRARAHGALPIGGIEKGEESARSSR